MKFIIQRVTEASVSVDEQLVGSIRQGYLVLIGVCDADTQAEADRLVRKMLNLRIFSDENGKTNLSLKDVDGELLVISQFTLYADCRKGNRPSFVKAGNPDVYKRQGQTASVIIIHREVHSVGNKSYSGRGG